MYQGFQQEYPVISTIAGPAVIVGGTFFLVGSGAGVPVAVAEGSALLCGAIINEVAGDKIGKGMDYISGKIGDIAQKSYPTLTDDEAKALGLGTIMLGSSVWNLKGSVQNVKSVAPKDTQIHFSKIDDSGGVKPGGTTKLKEQGVNQSKEKPQLVKELVEKPQIIDQTSGVNTEAKKISNIDKVSSNVVNEEFISQKALDAGWKPPYRSGVMLREITVAEDLTFYRVHSKAEKVTGEFLEKKTFSLC
jgi:hypothetical protein